MFIAVCVYTSHPFSAFYLPLDLVDYLPIFFQAVRHHSAARSGIDIIPFMLTMVLCLVISGGFVKKVGHYWSLLFLGPLYDFQICPPYCVLMTDLAEM
jgi:hypothetical protein